MYLKHSETQEFEDLGIEEWVALTDDSDFQIANEGKGIKWLEGIGWIDDTDPRW
jgi:hypothetical protein